MTSHQNNDVKNVQASRDVKAKLTPSNQMVELTEVQMKLLEDNFQNYGRGRNIDEITLQLVAVEAGMSDNDTEVGKCVVDWLLNINENNWRVVFQSPFCWN